MKRVKVLLAGVVVMALLLLTIAPAVQAQDLADTTHQAKFGSSAIVYVPGTGFVKEGGKETLVLVLRSLGDNLAKGHDYAINMLIDAGPGNCMEETIGTFSTYAGETEGLVDLDVADFPNPGQTLIGHLFARIKNKKGKYSFKTVVGWTEVEDGASDPDGISKKVKLTAKEKAPDKLGLQCIIP